MQPLNDRLYNLLRAKFERVEVANDGSEYRVNCPFCNDTRQRLYVNYRYGTYEPDTGSRNEHLLHCFNEACHTVKGHRDAFRRFLGLYRSCAALIPSPLPARPSSQGTPSVTPTLPTDDLVPIDALPASHHAVVYLRGRGFEPKELWDSRMVCYCEVSPGLRPSIYDRIIVPVFQPRRRALVGPERPVGEELRGWVARSVGDGNPKYLTVQGMKKSAVLYGLPEALAGAGPVCVCEGVTDCWRTGNNAVALIGKTMSQHQQDLLVGEFVGRPLVLCLDIDAAKEAEDIQGRLLAARRQKGDAAPVVSACLPPGRKDVGECTEEEVKDMVAAALDKVTQLIAPAAGPPTP
jgi:hypothetical protein